MRYYTQSGARLWGIFIAVVLSVFLVLPTQSTSAAAWDNRGGVNDYRGYFSNSALYTYNHYFGGAHTNRVILGGIWSNSVNSFVNDLRSINSGHGSSNTRTRADAAGAAFIVHTLLGRNGDQANSSGGRVISNADFNTLTTRLNAATISWNTTVCANGTVTWMAWTGNSATGQGDVQRTPSGQGVDLYECQSGISIRGSDGSQYDIFHSCANPVGAMQGLPSSSPANFQPSSDFNGTGSPNTVYINPTESANVRLWNYISNYNGMNHAITGRAQLQTNSGAWQDIHEGGYTASGNGNTFFYEETVGPGRTIPGSITSGRPATMANASTLLESCFRLNITNAGGAILAGGASNPSPASCLRLRGGNTTAQASASPEYIEPGQSSTLTGTINTSGYRDWSGAAGANYGVTCSWTITGLAGGSLSPTGTSGNCNQTISSNNPIVAVSKTYTSVASAPIGTRVCLNITISVPTGLGTSSTQTSCVTVVAKPYFKAFGGDVSAGCTGSGSAQIRAWNKGSAGAFAGSGGTFAAFALGNINEFASAQGGSGAGNIAGSAKGLTFASVTGTGNATYGGGFSNRPCVPDYYGSRPTSLSTIGSTFNPSTAASGAYGRAGDLVIGGGTVASGRNVDVYVNGNVRIGGDVTAANATNPSGPSGPAGVVASSVPNTVTETRLDFRWVTNGPTGSSSTGVRNSTTYSGPTGFPYCVNVYENGAEPAGTNWHDNWLCSNIDVGLSYTPAGAISGKYCASVGEFTDAHSGSIGWKDNFICTTQYVGIQYTLYASETTMRQNAGLKCMSMYEPSDASGWWSDNSLCWKEDMTETFGSIVDGLDIRFTTAASSLAAARTATGYDHCIQMTESAASAAWTWTDNWLCANKDIGWAYSQAGPPANRYCARVIEYAAPIYTWLDNFICSSQYVGLTFEFLGGAARPGASCVSLRESSDPYWSDGNNHLCWSTTRSMSTLPTATNPGPVTGLTAAQGVNGVGTARLSWNAPTNTGNRLLSDYIIEYEGSELSDGVGTALITNLSGLTLGASYTFTVYAQNTAGNRGPGTSITFTATSGTPIPVDVVTATVIPTFRLIVCGDVFIASNVTRVDATIIAQTKDDCGGNASQGGNLWTCAATSGFVGLPVSPANYNTCAANQLIVNGSLAANRIYLTRTYGTLARHGNGTNDFLRAGSGAANAGEIVQYNHLNWVQLDEPATAGSGGVRYDAITTLPPVL